LALGNGHLGLDIDCPGTVVGWCQVFEEGDWPDTNTCRCTQEANDCSDCRDGDHGGCGFYGMWIEEVGAECRSQLVDGCGVKAHALDFHSWEELLFGPNEWEITDYPVPVNVHWQDGVNLVVEPWHDHPSIDGGTT